MKCRLFEEGAISSRKFRDTNDFIGGTRVLKKYKPFRPKNFEFVQFGELLFLQPLSPSRTWKWVGVQMILLMVQKNIKKVHTFETKKFKNRVIEGATIFFN